MASINGISVRNLNEFRGHEGEPLCQGDLYLNRKKIGYWSQHFSGGPDEFRLEGGWQQEKMLDDAVKALNADKAIQGGTPESPFVIEYGLEFLMADLIALMDDEKEFKKAARAGYTGIMIVSDGYHGVVWSLPKDYSNLSDDSLKKIMGSEIAEVKKGFFPEDRFSKHSIRIYRSLKDFEIGQVIDLKQKNLEETIKDASSRSGAVKDLRDIHKDESIGK